MVDICCDSVDKQVAGEHRACSFEHASNGTTPCSTQPLSGLQICGRSLLQGMGILLIYSSYVQMPLAFRCLHITHMLQRRAWRMRMMETYLDLFRSKRGGVSLPLCSAGSCRPAGMAPSFMPLTADLPPKPGGRLLPCRVKGGRCCQTRTYITVAEA